MAGTDLARWGPAAWHTLHAFAHTSPRQLDAGRRARTCEFLRLFGEHLPCPACRAHFRAYLVAHLDEDALGTREDVVRFMNDAHNDVNRRLGKRTWTYEAHCAKFRRSRRRGGDALLWWCAAALGALALARAARRRRPRAT